MTAIDIVIPARDAAGTLPACLAGLAAAGFPPGAVTVADDGSCDATAALARAAGARVIDAGGRGAAAARNAAAAEGTAPVILFVDADVVARPDARSALEASLAAHPDHVAIFGAYDDAPPAPGLVSRTRNLLHRHVHRAGAGEAGTFWTGLGAVRRDAFEDVGGFDPGQRMMEDVAFGMALARAGHRILLDPSLEGTHLKRWSLAGMIRTDLLDRAIPWTRLMLSEPGGAAPGLNVSRAGQVSVLASGAALAALPLAPLTAPATVALAVALGALAAANRAFLAELARDRGTPFALGALGVLWAHYLAGGAGYAWARLTPRPRRAGPREAPSRARTPRGRSAPR